MTKRQRGARAPFPWRIRRKDAGRCTVEDANGIGVIGPNQVAWANAFLIASAPDLLMARKAAMQFLEDADSAESDIYAELNAVVRTAEIDHDPYSGQ